MPSISHVLLRVCQPLKNGEIEAIAFFYGLNFMKEIPLTRGFVALVDDDDFYKVAKGYKWSVTKGGYAQRQIIYRNGKASKELMHRVVAGLSVGDKFDVDHINGNKLDNRKENIRICTRGQNLKNMRLRKDNKTGVKGVWFCNTTKKFVATASENSLTVRIGSFIDVQSAKNALIEYRLKTHGEFANHGHGSVLLTKDKE